MLNFSKMFLYKAKKNGIPLYPNLVNLKSNTMKNTLQIYGVLIKMRVEKKILYGILCFFSIRRPECHV